MKTYKLSIGKTESSNKVVTVVRGWQHIMTQLSTHVVAAKKGGKYLIGGYYSGGVRKEEFMVARTLLVLDIDGYVGSIDDLAFDLEISVPGAFVAYSSYSHTKKNPRIRVVLPMSRELTPDEYRAFAINFMLNTSIPFEAFDACSSVPNQAMFLPQHPEGGEFWTMSQDGDELLVPDVIHGVDRHLTVDSSDEDDLDELSSVLANQPLDITPEMVDAYLSALDPTTATYDTWYKVGMALFHQFQGESVGFERWLVWSSRDGERFDEGEMPNKWRSFGGAQSPITFASIMHWVKEAGGIVAVNNMFDALLLEASQVESFEQYKLFKDKITAMSDHVLPPVYRSGVVSELADHFGKLHKVAKGAITKEMQASRVARAQTVVQPDWLDPWVYVESTCAFANADVADYMIKREAFNAKFDREPECVSAERQASQLALVNYNLQTVVDVMFFPAAGKFFTYEHKRMMNSYSPKGVAPCDVIDADGQTVVDMFLKHVAFTLEHVVEQELFLDWMAWIYQNPGKRVGWAMLLQGAPGTGKSYFGNVFEELLGTNVRSLDTQAISGRFTGWAHGSLVTVVEEIRIAGTNKYEILDKLKPIISNSTIQIEEKGRDHRTIPNFTSYFLLTNHKDAVPLGEGERRYCAMFSRIQSEEELFDALGGREKAREYFDELFANTRRRSDAIARFLLDRKIAKSFDPSGRAPDTGAKSEMKALSVSPDWDAIDDAITNNQCEVINKDIVDVTWMNKLMVGEGLELPKNRTASIILSEMGYSPIPGRKVKIYGVGQHYVWIRGSVDDDRILEVKNIVRNFHNSKNDNFLEKVEF